MHDEPTEYRFQSQSYLSCRCLRHCRRCRGCHVNIDLAAARITWSRLTTTQIDAVRDAAGAHGDLELVRKADRALARRRGAK